MPILSVWNGEEIQENRKLIGVHMEHGEKCIGIIFLPVHFFVQSFSDSTEMPFYIFPSLLITVSRSSSRNGLRK